VVERYLLLSVLRRRSRRRRKRRRRRRGGKVTRSLSLGFVSVLMYEP
jgi:hypothetical protein